MYGPLRLLYGLPSRRPSDRPPTLPLKVRVRDGDDWTLLPVPQERYPFLILFPYFSVPGALAGLEPAESMDAATNRFWIRGASPSHDFNDLLASLGRELGVHELQPDADMDVAAFCRLLAKIAIGYVAAELGARHVPIELVEMVIHNQLERCRHYIGSNESDEPAVDRLHEIAMGTFRPINVTAVRIRLLAKLGTPTYWVAIERGV
jgi:hypothetical protein